MNKSKQRQNGGRKFQRFCIKKHDKLSPHGMYQDGSCAICVKEIFTIIGSKN